MFRKLIKRYILLFALFYAAYSFLNWYFTTRTGLVQWNKILTNFAIPFVLIYFPVYIFFNRPVSGLPVNAKLKEALVWAILPFSISIPTAMSQQYFKDISYGLIPVKNPEAVLLHPKERFFSIRDYEVQKKDFVVYEKEKERRRSRKLYQLYLAPLYADSLSPKMGKAKLAYGLVFSTRIGNGSLLNVKEPREQEEFRRETREEFENLDLKKAAFFEKLQNSDEANDFREAWKRHPLLDQQAEPIILRAHEEEIRHLYKRRRNIALYSVLICFGLTLGFLLLLKFLVATKR